MPIREDTPREMTAEETRAVDEALVEAAQASDGYLTFDEWYRVAQKTIRSMPNDGR
jgi:hypothetical protein